jgi:hypothetical protein
VNVYEAVMKAADHIERNPWRYDFCRAINSPGVDGNGCLVGWIAFYMGETAGQRCGESLDAPEEIEASLCKRLLGIGFSDFVYRMGLLNHELREAFTSHAPTAATCLRRYASKYLTPPAPKYNFEALAARLAREPLALTHVRERVA